MKQSRFTDGQIIAILKQAESGMPVPDVCREHNIAEAADVPRVPSVNIQPPGHLDRALRDAALGARVSNERTTEFALSLIWVPDDPASDTPIRLQRVDVRSRVRPGLDLYRDSVP